MIWNTVSYPLVMAGLVPAIHAFRRLGGSGLQDVDARIKSGQSVC